ncbi:AAA family ATPase [Prochlorococcus sp. MIT 1300]|uniref:AAA family ATPase n=1 Tax=Prochlorococcus sp. MIT 1300 TaxID=3096218 RepID=UPI002A75F716|nr:AAA family ATPase [Prochlorococcus sp. MIT 1300]
MKPKRITDDLDKMLGLLPPGVQKSLSNSGQQDELLEVVLDLGRIPEARYPDKVLALGDKYITKYDLQAIVNRLGKFGTDNRAGIERTLHRISAIRNRQQEIIGLTCRVGRAIFGTVELVRDLLNSGQSLLLMGPPGIGKTTVLREIARVLAEDLQKRVVVIDTSNEIAGDGDIPHPAIGRARRMQVAKPEYQHQTMIEAVENHMPQVIVIDEIGTELEANAARTIAERGVQLVATAHGNSLSNLIKNPTLSDLVGGIQSVTLSDEEARRRRTQKSVLERAADPTFPVAVEIANRNSWFIHTNVAATIDLILRGEIPQPQKRKIDKDGRIKLIDMSPMVKHPGIKNIEVKKPSPVKESINSSNVSNEPKKSLNGQINSNGLSTAMKILSCGISKHLLEEVINQHDWPIICVNKLEEADVLLSAKNNLAAENTLRKQAREEHIPILVIKSNTPTQVERALGKLLEKHKLKVD